MNSELEISKSNARQYLSIKEIKDQANLIKQILKEVLIKGKHYGTIPGINSKLCLYKSGAEKIASIFRIAIDPVITNLSFDGEIKYLVSARGTCMDTGKFLGAGIGVCSSMEDKYKWKAPVNEKEYEETPCENRREKWKKGVYNKPDYVVKQIVTNCNDVGNTVLKMAKKRAMIDLILTVTAASDIFDEVVYDIDPDDSKKQNSEILSISIDVYETKTILENNKPTYAISSPEGYFRTTDTFLGKRILDFGKLKCPLVLKYKVVDKFFILIELEKESANAER